MGVRYGLGINANLFTVHAVVGVVVISLMDSFSCGDCLGAGAAAAAMRSRLFLVLTLWGKYRYTELQPVGMGAFGLVW